MQKIKLIATGGTIAMRKDSFGKTVPAVTGHDLLESIPELRESAFWDVEEFSNLASCNFNPERMLQLARRVKEAFADPDCMGIIITHGTDTLEETAYFWSLQSKTAGPSY